MTRIDQTPFSDQNRDDLDLNADGGHHGAPGQISFEQSVEAYCLAVQSNALHSCEDLVLTGTWQKYEQRAASIARKHSSRDPFISYLAVNAGDGWKTANSRQSYRSALIRMAAQEILELAPIYWRQVITNEKNEGDQRCLLRCLQPHIDGDARNRMRDAPEPLSDDRQRRLDGAIAFLLEVPPDPHHTALRGRPAKNVGEEDPGASRSSASKKTALYALNQHQRRKAKTVPNYDWRSNFWAMAVVPDDHLDDHRRACIAALMLTGCRPSEFSDDLGVSVHKVTMGDHSSLRFQILGAKLSDEIGDHPGKGQDHREIELMCQTEEALWLFDHVSSMGEDPVVLQLPVVTHKQTGEMLMPSERHRRVSVSLGKLIKRLGKAAFPMLRHQLTPYVFRHAFTSDFKAGGHTLDAFDLAAALGHQSARTQEHYGNANSARGLAGNRALQITKVGSATPVRQPERPSYPSATHFRIESEI